MITASKGKIGLYGRYIYNVIAADIKTVSLYGDLTSQHESLEGQQKGVLLQSGNVLPSAGTAITITRPNPEESIPGPPLYRVLFPALLSGTRCYTDASTLPDSTLQVPRKAGLRVFIVNNQSQTSATIYIKVVLTASTSVLMAEAAALALAARIISALDIHAPTFLLDNRQLVTFFNGKDIDNPPHWEIKLFTQSFINLMSNRNSKILKISRKLNTTAHILATQALQSMNSQYSWCHFTCSNHCHIDGCSTMERLISVIGEGFTILAVSCC